MNTAYLACDLGAESGRLMLGTLDGGKLVLEEIHRFPNAPLKVGQSLHWDIPKLLDEVIAGLFKAAQRKLPVASISTDSWGVDYLLFADDDTLLSPTFHYRDPRTKAGVDAVLAKVDWKTVFAETGIQFMVLNTLFQLGAESADRLARTKRILGIGDGFNYLLGGKPVAEESLASTFQLYNPRTKAWSDQLIRILGIRRDAFPAIVPSGTLLGTLSPEISRKTGLRDVQVVASCSHDTGAAVAAVPASGRNWAYLSSGTWSLMGVELDQPIMTEHCRELNFTNEIGFGGSVRLLKNIIGLWLVQECRRDWMKTQRPYDYAELVQLAGEAQPFVSLINPADPRFLGPEEMPAKIAAFCRETSQPVPNDPGATIRCILESLALLYRRTLGQIGELIGARIERLHIVGGGSKNQLLNQLTADALQIPIVAGPVEATAAGNILVQALALGHLPNLTAARAVVRGSLEMQIVQPRPGDACDRAYARFAQWL